MDASALLSRLVSRLKGRSYEIDPRIDQGGGQEIGGVASDLPGKQPGDVLRLVGSGVEVWQSLTRNGR